MASLQFVPEIVEPAAMVLENEKPEVAEYVRRWGNAASVALFDPACLIFSTPLIKGIIGYRIESKCAAVFGDPVCAPEDKIALAKAFDLFCQELNLRTVYITTSEFFSHAALKEGFGVLMEMGEELTIDPHHDPKKGSEGRLLRGKVKQAQRGEVVVKEYLLQDAKLLEHAIEQVGVEWLNARKGPQIYLAHVNLFAERVGRRWFYAQQGEKVVGVVLLNELEVRKGWLLNLLMVTPEACKGTSELLVASVMETLGREGCHFLTFGIAQADQLGEIIGLGKIFPWIARKMFRFSKKIFSLDGKRKYWKKFQPQGERSFLLFKHARVGFREISAIMKALNVNL